MNGPHLRQRTGTVLRRMLEEWRQDRVPDLAAEVAFFGVLSLFPALLAFAAVLGALDAIVGQDLAGRIEGEVLDALRSVLTDEADGTVDAVSELFTNTRPALLTFSLLVAIWTLSRGFASLVRALDVVYDIDEHRAWLRIRATALALAIGSLLAGAVMLALVVIGPLLGTGDDVASAIGLGDEFVVIWDLLRMPVAFVLLVCWATTIFHIAPDHQTPWRSDLPGALLTTVLWLVFSGGLRLYVGVAQSGNAVTGTLGGILIVLLWFWLLSLAVLIGGELNQVLLHEGVVPEERTTARREPGEGSAPVEGGADGGHERTGLDGAPSVEEDAHDG